jgi:D-amino peptidase
MKFYIGVDCEGPACVVGSPGGSLNDSRNLAFAKLQATREADAAARACFDAGATEVIVWDNHGGSLNLEYDLLDSRCKIALGVGFPHRWPGIDETFMGVLFIGYHAMDSTEDAVMAHTYSSAAHQWVKVNGRMVGELAIDAAIAGLHGVPPLFVAGDDKCVAEGREFFGELETVTTKNAFGWNAAVSLHPKAAVEAIYAGVRDAVERRTMQKPFRFEEPLTYEVRYKRIEQAESASRGTSTGARVDAYTVKWEYRSIRDRY